MGTQEGHIGDADEGPLLARPEPDDRALLRDLGGSIKVGKAHTAQVGGQADEDVPRRETGWKVRPVLAEAAPPAAGCLSPPPSGLTHPS